MTGLTLAGLYRVFGASVQTAKVFIVTLSALTCGFIFKTGKDSTGDHRVGLAAAIFFAVMPSLVAYSGIPTSEHMAIFLITLTTSIWIFVLKSEKLDLWNYTIVMYLVVGALIGLVDWFRPVGFILLIAFMISELIYLRKDQKILMVISRLVVMVIAAYLVSDLSVVISEKMHGVDLPSVRQKFGQHVLIGTNLKSGGTHNWEDQQIIFDTYRMYSEDYDKASSQLVQLAFERVKENRAEIPHLLEIKFKRVWGNNWQLFDASLDGSNDEELVAYLNIIDALLFVSMTFLVGIATIFSILKRSTQEIFMMQLFILGLALVLLILEVQMRYRSVLFPYLMILGTIGMRDGLNTILVKRDLANDLELE
jgi:4-amino-4-deoxy-L-arabinose transferase-like glycosyltransferase